MQRGFKNLNAAGSGLVPVAALVLCPRLTWGLIANADVAKSPSDLSYRVGAPIS